MKLYAKEIVTLLLTRETLTQKELVQILNEQTDKSYTQAGLSRKLSQGTITYNEVANIIDVLGYDVELIKNNK
ncbi:hypothetical protein IJ707_00130 [bacterium]|nr:hypothetical protein [bacterium]